MDASGNVLLGGSDSAAWLGDNNTQPLDPYHGLIGISLVKLSATVCWLLNRSTEL